MLIRMSEFGRCWRMSLMRPSYWSMVGFGFRLTVSLPPHWRRMVVGSLFLGKMWGTLLRISGLFAPGYEYVVTLTPWDDSRWPNPRVSEVPTTHTLLSLAGRLFGCWRDWQAMTCAYVSLLCAAIAVVVGVDVDASASLRARPSCTTGMGKDSLDVVAGWDSCFWWQVVATADSSVRCSPARERSVCATSATWMRKLSDFVFAVCKSSLSHLLEPSFSVAFWSSVYLFIPLIRESSRRKLSLSFVIRFI